MEAIQLQFVIQDEKLVIPELREQVRLHYAERYIRLVKAWAMTRMWRTDDPLDKLPQGVIYEDFKQYCVRHHKEPLSRTYWRELMVEAGYNPSKHFAARRTDGGKTTKRGLVGFILQG